MEILHRISLIEILIVDLIIFLFVIAGFINVIKNMINAALSPTRKRSRYHADNTSSWVDTGNYGTGNYFNSSCDSGSFDAGGDCGGGGD
ncbi:MAG: hypothetical protein AAFW70_11630 [Cyanobacteria bacterium J06635_10]